MRENAHTAGQFGFKNVPDGDKPNISTEGCVTPVRLILAQMLGPPWQRLRSTPVMSSLLLRQTTSELWWLSGGKRGDCQNCSVLYCVLKLCTAISSLRWAFLTVLCIGFCCTGPISLCLDSLCLCLCFYVILLYCICVVLTRWGGLGGIED